MCNNFIEDFSYKVIEKLNYENCGKSRYKLFDENLIKFIGKVYYSKLIDPKFYIDLSIYFFHKDVKRFVDILKILNISEQFIIIIKIANEIKNNHQHCLLEDNNTIIFKIYDNISWLELSCIDSQDKNTYFGEKQKMNFNSWLKIFLNYFAN